MVRYFRGLQRDPDYQAYDDTWGEVVLLSAVWAAGRLQELPGWRPTPAPVPEKIVLRFADKLELPDLTEAHRVDYVSCPGKA